MEFNQLINRYLVKDPESRKRNLHIRTYAVIPLNEECGLIEWIPNLIGLRHILNKIYKEKGLVTSNTDLKRLMPQLRDTLARKKEIFQKGCHQCCHDFIVFDDRLFFSNRCFRTIAATSFRFKRMVSDYLSWSAGLVFSQTELRPNAGCYVYGRICCWSWRSPRWKYPFRFRLRWCCPCRSQLFIQQRYPFSSIPLIISRNETKEWWSYHDSYLNLMQFHLLLPVELIRNELYHSLPMVQSKSQQEIEKKKSYTNWTNRMLLSLKPCTWSFRSCGQGLYFQ